MAHQAKRPYAGSQPSITSYFSPSNTLGTGQYMISSHYATTSKSEGGFPAIPASVQTNLLNVGMRVRKSVPEGYKTASYSAFSLFADNTPLPQSTPSQKIVTKTRPRAGVRELTPFCGIMKVGGMAQQPWSTYESQDVGIHMDEAMDDIDEEEEVPFLSSQGSAVSNVSVTTTSRDNKRRFFEDGEENENEPTSVANRGSGLRVIAVPKRKGRGMDGCRRAEQENITVIGQDVDFEDAEFLDYGLDMEMNDRM